MLNANTINSSIERLYKPEFEPQDMASQAERILPVVVKLQVQKEILAAGQYSL